MLNKVEIIGNLGKDPEVKTFEGGNQVATFSVATSEKWKNKDGELEQETTWHNVVFWGKLAGVIEKYVHKGDRLYISGKIKTRSWEKDGETKYITEIIGREMIMLSTKSESAPGGNRAPGHEPAAAAKAQPQTAEQGQAAADEIDDLPF